MAALHSRQSLDNEEDYIGFCVQQETPQQVSTEKPLRKLAVEQPPRSQCTQTLHFEFTEFWSQIALCGTLYCAPPQDIVRETNHCVTEVDGEGNTIGGAG